MNENDLRKKTADEYEKTDMLWEQYDEDHEPSMTVIYDYVQNPLLEELCNHVEATYDCKPALCYSNCSMQRGWNIKYKKAGRALCTLYPMKGYFIALVVIGNREQTEIEFMLPMFSEYLQQLYHETNAGMGQKWLMINVTSEDILKDVEECIAIRRGKKYAIG